MLDIVWNTGPRAYQFYFPSVDESWTLPQADKARSKAQELRDAIKSTNASMAEAEKHLSVPLGANKEWVEMYAGSECFSISRTGNTYSMCPFDRATQTSGDKKTVSLGRWDGWGDNGAPVSGATGAVEPSATWVFSAGDRCWQGQIRTLQVSIKCHGVNEILSVDEPSTCSYVMKFGTPLACPPPSTTPSEMFDQQSAQSISTRERVDL